MHHHRTRFHLSILLLALSVVTLCGCPDSDKPATGPASTSPTEKPRANQLCEENLTNAFSSLDPRRLEISADIESTLNVLND